MSKSVIHLLNVPESYSSGWIPAKYARCNDSRSWTYHVRFRVYKTSKSFAVQFDEGAGSKSLKSPNVFTRSTPVYRKDIDKIWSYIFKMLDFYNARYTTNQSGDGKCYT